MCPVSGPCWPGASRCWWRWTRPIASRSGATIFDRTIGAWVSISDNASLKTIAGLNALLDIPGYVFIGDNPALEKVSGLSSLLSVGEFTTIARNDVLVDIAGLSAMISVAADVVVIGNPQLPQCRVDAWLADVSVGGTVDVRDTATAPCP